jgi:hypothetical protein
MLFGWLVSHGLGYRIERKIIHLRSITQVLLISYDLGLRFMVLRLRMLDIRSRSTQVGQAMIMSKGYMGWYHTTHGTLLDGATNMTWLT